MEKPKAFGLWVLGTQRIVSSKEFQKEPAEINGKIVYCPFCRRRMKMWLEGCTLWHIECEKCNFCFTMKTVDGEIFERLVGIIYE